MFEPVSPSQISIPRSQEPTIDCPVDLVEHGVGRVKVSFASVFMMPVEHDEVDRFERARYAIAAHLNDNEISVEDLLAGDVVVPI